MKRKSTNALLSMAALSLVMGLSACQAEEKAGTESPETAVVSGLMAENGEVTEQLSAEQTSMEQAPEQPLPTETGKAEGDTPQNGVADPAVQAGSTAGTETLDGDIESLDNGSFIINKTFTETMDDGSMLAFSSNEDKTLVTVTYTDSTRLILRKVKNGGVNPSDISDSGAGIDDLKAGVSVSMTGVSTDNGFAASEIIIYQFH